MAWLEKRGGSFHLCVRLGEQKFKRSLKTINHRAAETAVSRVDRRLKLIEDGVLSIADDADSQVIVGGLRPRRIVSGRAEACWRPW